MSTKNVKKFLEQIKTDESLSRALTKLTSSVRADIKQCNEKEVIAKYILPVAKEYGLDFTIDEFTAVVDSEIKKLSKNELLAVSGGKTFRAPALGLLFASVLAFAHSSGDNFLNVPVFEKVAEATGLPKELESNILANIKEQLKSIDLSKKTDLDDLVDITKGIIYYTLKVNNIKFKEDVDIPNLFHCTDENGGNFDVSVANLIEMALEETNSIRNHIVAHIKEQLKYINLSKKADLAALADVTEGIIHHVLKINDIQFTKDNRVPNLFHCTSNEGAFDVSVDGFIEMALETPDDIKVDIIEDIRRRHAKVKAQSLEPSQKPSQPLTFDRFIEEIRLAVYNSLYNSDLSPVPEQGDKFLFHCIRNGTKFNVDVAKLIEEALGPSM